MANDELIIKSKKAKGMDGYKIFSIRIKEDIVDHIETIAQKTGRSRIELIGIFLDYAVKNCHIEEE